MNDLLNYIGSELRKIYPKVFLERAPQNTQYPFVTYNLPYSTDDFQKEDLELEVDIWGNSPDTTEIETITDNINTAFHRRHAYIAGKFQADFYRTDRMMLEDDRLRIRRREVRFVVKTYFL